MVADTISSRRVKQEGREEREVFPFSAFSKLALYLAFGLLAFEISLRIRAHPRNPRQKIDGFPLVGSISCYLPLDTCYLLLPVLFPLASVRSRGEMNRWIYRLRIRTSCAIS
jgi:hypothetical protein